MAQGYDLDLEMLLVLPFSWGSATTLGLVEDDIVPFIDAGEVMTTFGNIELTIGAIVAVAALIAVTVMRDASITDTDGIDLWIMYATFGLVLAPPLFPAFAETIAETPAALISFIVQSTGFMLVSYIN